MAMEKITENGVAIALVTGTCALTDEQTALDLIHGSALHTGRRAHRH